MPSFDISNTKNETERKQIVYNDAINRTIR